jgi:hypothetical protein
MKRTSLAIAVFILTVTLQLVISFPSALADTALNTELVTNGGAESGSVGTIGGWTDETGASRWSSSTTYSDWAVAVEGSRFFFLYNPSMDSLSGDMSQWITLSGTEGTGLFSGISAGNIAMHFTIHMYQKITAANEVKAVIEQYSASGTLLATSNVVSTTAGSGVFSAYELNTQLNPSTRKFKLILSATLTIGGYAQYDAISLKLADASTGSAPVFGSDFPTEGTTDINVAYTHGFTITDADAGDIDNLTFSVNSDNVNMVPAANVVVSGSGTSRTFTVTPVSNLSGEANITLTASDGSKSTDATLHLVVSKVITLSSNLVENGNATSGYASWLGSNVNVTASGNGFIMSSTGYGMYQKLDISKFSAIIDGSAADYEFKVSGIWGGGGQVVLQFYSDIACTIPVGGTVTVNNSNLTRTDVIPAGALGAIVTFSSTASSGTNVTIRDISFIIPNNFPKMNVITTQTSQLSALTVPVIVYYNTASATLTATSSNQTIVTNAGITAGGSGFNRSLTFTPLKQGTVTITTTLNDGLNTASRTFDVTVHEPATVSSIDMPDAGYYITGGNLDFTVVFSRNIQGGTGSTLPLTIGGSSEEAAYLSATANTITYRYTLGSSDEGLVVLGTAIEDTSSAITDTEGYDAVLDFSAGATSVAAITTPEVTSTATGGTAVYGTKITFTASLTCVDTLAGTVQFLADGVNIGSPVTLSGNQASYQTDLTTLDSGSPTITASFIPSGTGYQFINLNSSALSLTITPKSVTVTGLAATPKTYDGSTAITLSGGSLSGVLTGDTVSADYPIAGTSASANKGTRTVSFSAITLNGADKENYTIAAQPSVSVDIAEKTLTVTATAVDKPYDGTTTAVVSAVVFDGLVTGETLTSGIDYSASAVFDSAAIGQDIPVTVTITLLATTKAGNYTLTANIADTQADITRKVLTITGVTATNRVYNGDASVVLSGGVLVGVESADIASISFTLGTGSTSDPNAGSAKPVTTSITLTGDTMDTYTLTQPNYVTVNIEKASLTVSSATAADKGYDGTASATATDVAVNGFIAGEALIFGTDYTATGTFSNANVGDNKTVTVTVTLAGTAIAGNYALPVSTINTTASITNSGVTITGVTATDRAYDGTTAVGLTGGTLVGIKAADVADIGFTLNTGTISDANAGNAKPLTTNTILTGSKAGNYTLTQPNNITVDITKKVLTLTGATVADKTYDGTTNATVTSVIFGGLAAGESLSAGVDYTAGGVFVSAGVGTGIPVTVTVALLDTALSKNYTVTGTTSTAAAIAVLSLTGTVGIDVTNTTGDANMIDEGDVLSINTDGITVPGTLTFNYQWYRNGTNVSGSICTVGNLTADPIGTVYNVKVTGTGNYQGVLESAAATVAEITLSGGVTITGDTVLGDVLTLNTNTLTPTGATYNIHWLRDGTEIVGATYDTYTITKPDQGTTLTATVTGKGYFNGLISATIDVPPSPYVPDAGIVEYTDKVTVDLTLGLTLLSEDQMLLLYSINATKPVVFNGNGYSFTFATGTLMAWSGDLNLGIRFNTGTGYVAIMDATGSDFVLMLEYLHSGALPGVSEISIDVGVKYAGQLMRYLYYNPMTAKLELVQTVLVDANGRVTVTQDHCSSYGIARLGTDSVPKTGDNNPLTLWWILAGISTVGLLALLLWRLHGKVWRKSYDKGAKHDDAPDSI